MSTREVFLEGPSPWGFRMTGGADVGHPLRISRVNPGSKSSQKGIREGDLITSINGQQTKCLTNSESHALLRTVKENLRLGLNEDKNVSPRRRSKEISKKAESIGEKEPPVSVSPPVNKGCNDLNMGEKPSSSKCRRQRRSRMKNRLKQLFGLGKSEKSVPFNDESSSIEEISTPQISYPEESDCGKNSVETRIMKERDLNRSSEQIYEVCLVTDSKMCFIEKTDKGSQDKENLNKVENTKKNVSIQNPPVSISNDDGNYEYIRKETPSGKVFTINKVVFDQNNPKFEVPFDSNDSIQNGSSYTADNQEVKIVVHSPEECKVESLSGFTDRYSSEPVSEEILEENVQFFPANNVMEFCNATLTVENENSYELSASDVNVPLIPVEEEEKLRSFLDTLELSKSPTEDKTNIISDVQIQELNVPTHFAQSPSYLANYFPTRTYLEVISEENSDLSDVDKPWENTDLIRQNNDIDGIPEDWKGSQDGIDTSWQNGKSLEEVSDVQIISDSHSDTDDGKPEKEGQFSSCIITLPEDDDESQLPKTNFANSNVEELTNPLKEKKFVKLDKKPPPYKYQPKDKAPIKSLPSFDVVKNVVSSYYNTKYVTSPNTTDNESISELTNKPNSDAILAPKIINDVEIVYIDSSDSEATSVKSDAISIQSGTFELDDVLEDIRELENDSSMEKRLSNNESFQVENNLSVNNKPIILAENAIENQNQNNFIFNENEQRVLEAFNSIHNTFLSTEKIVADMNKELESLELSLNSQQSLDPSIDSEEISFSEDFLGNVLSLKELSANVIMGLPNGNILLRELGVESYDSVSEYFPETSEYSCSSGTKTSIMSDVTKSHTESRDEKRNDYSEYLESSASSGFMFYPEGKSSTNLEASEPEVVEMDKKWVVVPVVDDPRLLLCLSPSQSKKLPSNSQYASDILDLHQKFLYRRGYHEKPEKKEKQHEIPEPDLISMNFKHKQDVENYTPEILSRTKNNLRERTDDNCFSDNVADIYYSDNREKNETDISCIHKLNSTSCITYQNVAYDVGVVTEDKKLDGKTVLVKDMTKDKPYSENKSDMQQTESSQFVTKCESYQTVGNSRLLELIQSEVKSSPSDPEGRDMTTSASSTSQNDIENHHSCSFDRKTDSSTIANQENESSIDNAVEPQLEKEGKCYNNVSSNYQNAENNICKENQLYFDAVKYRISKKGDIAIYDCGGQVESLKKYENDRPKSLPPSGEIFREKMYKEYMDKVAERSERRQQKVIKVSNISSAASLPSDIQHLENEFMEKVKERMNKLGIAYDEFGEERFEEKNDQEKLESLPKHLQELVDIMEECGVWSPIHTPELERKKFDFSQKSEKKESKEEKNEQQPVIWTPSSTGASPTLERKFRTINFESPPPKRKEYKLEERKTPELPKELPIESTFDTKNRLVTSTSENSSLSSQLRLPSAQNPTITLLQKAREGQLPRGAQYLETKTSDGQDSSAIGPNEILYTVKREITSESEGSTKKIVELGPRKFEGIGPTAKDGTPLALRSEVKEDNQQRWYKRMYDSLHKAEQDKDYVTVRYKTKRKGQYPYTSAGGYLSEPERLTYDSDAAISKYATLDRRRIKNKENDFATSTMPRNKYTSAGIRHAVNVYKNQPGRIEDYEPGRSSIAEKETKQWWDEVMDIFDEEFTQDSRNKRSLTSLNVGRPFPYAPKEAGYESDSMLMFKRRYNSMDSQPMSPVDQKTAYKVIQKGGEVPFQGLRKPAPERPKESPHRYLESEVNIHYRSPIRTEAKAAWPEEELAQKQAEVMRRIYQEQRRTKYLNELQDMYSRRHTDNFIPSQKSPIPLNRYDDFPMETQPPRPRDRTPEPKLVARALYNFIGQTSRELSFRRGDIIFVRRQIDKNWYEGEHNAMIGLFPFNYVEIIPYDGIRTLPKKATEGQARAKFNFQAQTHLELSLVKGELVLLTRRVDENWFEGRIGNRKGIFPVSYVEVLVEPGERNVTPTGPLTNKPLVAPASHSVMLNGAKDLGQQHYQPPRPATYSTASLPSKHKMNEISLVSQALHIDTQSEPVPYRVLYNYKPQNDDELELREGDIVYVMEKCDDGWYVGSIHRNGQFGTFPGNYVERIQ